MKKQNKTKLKATSPGPNVESVWNRSYPKYITIYGENRKAIKHDRRKILFFKSLKLNLELFVNPSKFQGNMTQSKLAEH